MPLWPWMVLITVTGACVGSFLNVVIYRLPEGKSLVRPPSHCPSCGRGLRAWQNVPVLGWLYLRGRCHWCKAPISIQYPLVEAACAILFGGLTWVYYASGWRYDFRAAGLEATWPVLSVHLVLVAALLAATVVDARRYIIPLQIPWLATAAAVIGLPLGVWLVPGAAAVVPRLDMQGLGLAAGGAFGLLVAVGLLRAGIIPYSFAEAHNPDADTPIDPEAAPAAGDQASPTGASSQQASGQIDYGTPEQWLAHPRPRREVAKELLFLLPVAVGMALGLVLARTFAGSATMPLWLHTLAGVGCGYLAGGGLIWITRILGTLVFGKEAMGLGDVHLLAAIGAVVGAAPGAVAVFFIAPFMGLAAALLTAGINRLIRGEVRVIPYGPYLAAAAVVWMATRDVLWGQAPLW